ncbi:hydrolase [Aspergillus sclerotialis]|uniref:Hydrolase n=1 Tax=Aspergillus sclerotialis TaxID=2070753 RepID=A0A3A2ZY31_9EURO|nr:hydrolase [Aspergillus sclerotialis]
MAVAPLESSSTPPRDTSTEPTRPSNDSMEDIDPQSTRKRPRLDSGSGACETLATDKSSIPRMSEQSEPASAVPEQETSTSASRPPTNRVTINMKSPKSIDMSSETLDSSPDGAAPRTQSTEIDGNNASAAISVSSSPAQSPEIEVAEVEDMDQDPNASNWKPLGQALRDRANAEVVQLHDQYSLADMFPKFHDHLEQPGSLEQIALIIEKGSPSDVKVFLDLKTWLDHVVHNLDQLTHETFIDDRDFWEDLPILIESLLRRGSDFQPDEGEGTWACFEEFFLCYAQLALHLIHLDTLGLKHMLEHPEIQVLDLKSKFYLAPLGWILQISGIPFFQALEKMYGSEVADMVARIGDHLGSPPLDTVHQLSEFCRCAMALVPQWPILSQSLITVLVITGQLVESGFERRRYGADDNLIDSPVYMMTLKSVYGLLRDLDEKYQVHISKKSPWVGNDTSEALISRMSAAYQSICLRDPRFALQTVANDLSIDLSSATTPEDRASVIYYDWRFRILKKQIIDGRMELRVHGMETMQSDLVNVWKQYFQGNPPGIMHPVVSYLVAFLREHKIVDYVLGIDSHPQLISRSYNIVGFLIVTSTYTDVDTDTIWETVIESQDPRTVSEVLGMFSKIFQMHQLEALLYLSSKLLDLPLDRFDGRMIEHAEQLLHTIREKYAERNRHAPWDTLYVDAIPVRLCVRLIRDSSAAEELSVEQKTHLQKFAGAQLSQFINVGLSETDKMETYERCIQDIAEMNQFTTGSLQALHALLPNYELQEIRKLATDFDLTRLVINEISHVLEMNQTDFTDPFSRAGFGSRVNILARIIDKVPDTITDDLADILWKKVFTSKNLVYYARRSLWDMLCAVTVRSTKRNPFVDHCIEACLPQLLPGDYSLELLSFVKQTIGYEIRFDPPQLACENEVISIPGMDRVWNLILNAPPCSIETEATDFAIEVYLDHNLINRSPRSAVEATHIALVDRCVEQLKSAAAKLKAVNEDAIPGNDVSMITAASDIEIQAEELRFSRSLLFLRQLLHGLRTRPQYSPPQGPPPDLPGKPVKGELVSINYQAFHGGASSKIRSLRIGDLSTASELVDRLVELTGFSKFSTIYGGQKIGLLENPDVTVRDLKLRSGLLIVRRDADSREVSLAGRRQSLTLVDSEVLKHFDNLYDLLFLEDHLAREIYEFLVVFPPQERALQLVKSENKTEDEMFPMEKPYSFLYSVNALSACLAEESSEASPNESFISRSIAVLVAALTRSELSEAIEKNSMKLSLASSLVECLRTALSVTYQLQSDSPVISNPVPLVERLLGFLEIGRHLPSTSLSPIDIQKLICNSFAILTDTSVHGLEFWTAVKRLVQLDQLLVSLLLDEKRQEVRKEISEIIVIACSPLQMAKDSAKSSNGKIQKPTAAPENTLKTDVLTTIWDAFARTLPQAANFVPQSQEFFEVALLIFYLMGEKSPSTLRLSEYLKQWGAIMREYRTEQVCSQIK